MELPVVTSDAQGRGDLQVKCPLIVRIDTRSLLLVTGLEKRRTVASLCAH
jgi:hypothetical protein